MVEIFSADGWLNKSIVSINDFTWSYILVAALILCALWFTFRTHFVQFRMVGEMVRLLGESTDTHDKGEKHVSSFQAFAVSIASRVGTGNLAGVASAIAIGGPGPSSGCGSSLSLGRPRLSSSQRWPNCINVAMPTRSLADPPITSFMVCIANGCRSSLPS